MQQKVKPKIPIEIIITLVQGLILKSRQFPSPTYVILDPLTLPRLCGKDESKLGLQKHFLTLLIKVDKQIPFFYSCFFFFTQNKKNTIV